MTDTGTTRTLQSFSGTPLAGVKTAADEFMNYQAIVRHPFIVDNFWYGLSSILLNLLNYAYVLVALHYLSKGDFGAFNALVALLTLATVVANPLQLQVTKTVSQSPRPLLWRHVARIGGFSLKLMGVGLLCLVLASSALGSMLNVSPGNIVMLGFAMGFLILAALATAISSGLRRLTFQASLGLISTVVKLLCAIVLFESGLGVTAGLTGYVAGFALTTVLTLHALKTWERATEPLATPEIHNTSVHVLVVAYIFIAAPFSMDQILAQTLSPEISGDYAALVTIGKLAFFVSAPFQVVLYSYLAGSSKPRQQMNYLLAGLAIATGSSLLFTAVLWAGGQGLTDLLLSPVYASVAGWIVPYSLGICGYVFAYAVVSLAIARSDPRILVPLSLATITQTILFLFRHDSLAQLVANQLACMGLLVVGALGYLVFCHPPASPATHQ